MLKEKSILRIKQSRYRNKLRAQKNHIKRLKERRDKKLLLQRNYRNLNAVVLTAESLKHSYIKFIISVVLNNKGYDIITEYPLKNSECDIYCPSLGIICEVQNSKNFKTEEKKKLEKYDYLIQTGVINDIYFFNNDDFKGRLDYDTKLVEERLGL